MGRLPVAGDAVVDLDALVALAARRGSGLRTRRAGVGLRVTPRAARWAYRNVCHPPVFSIADMVAIHVRRRATRTDFVADSPASERTVVMAWRLSGRSSECSSEHPGERDLTLVVAFEDELRGVYRAQRQAPATTGGRTVFERNHVGDEVHLHVSGAPGGSKSQEIANPTDEALRHLGGLGNRQRLARMLARGILRGGPRMVLRALLDLVRKG